MILPRARMIRWDHPPCSGRRTRTSVRNAMPRTIPDMSTVALAVTDGMLHFELSVAYEVFASAPAGMADPWYDVAVCGPGPVRVGRFRLEPDHGLDQLAQRRHRDRPGWADVDVDAARRPGRRGARGPRGGRARGLPVHGRVRTGRGRPAGRATRDHALGAHRGAGRPLSQGGGRPGRALRRQRQRAHLRGQGRRDGPVPAPGPPRPRLVDRQRRRPPPGRATAPGRWPGPVRHHPGARPGRPPARRTAPLGDRTASTAR